MNILQQKYLFFNRASRHVPRQLEKLFFFGCSAFALRNVASVRGNARTCAANYHTAKTKAWRLTRNPRWSAVFPRLLGELGAVTAASRVAVDFSSFGPFQVLTFAVQTRLGRALPVYFEIITYPITKDSQKPVHHLGNRAVRIRCIVPPHARDGPGIRLPLHHQTFG